MIQAHLYNIHTYSPHSLLHPHATHTSNIGFESADLLSLFKVACLIVMVGSEKVAELVGNQPAHVEVDLLLLEHDLGDNWAVPGK